MNQFTEHDAFELDGCGRTAERRALLRRVQANMPRHVNNMLKRRRELQDEYERGYENGRCEALGFEVK